MQKFQKHDLVRVAKDLGSHMSHFTADVGVPQTKLRIRYT
jgi:hypothetical protein